MTKQLFGMALAAAWIGTTAVWAQAPAVTTAPVTTTARRNAPVSGAVTAVDAAKKTLTVMERRSGTSVTLTLATDAKVLVTQAAVVGDIKAGTLLQAYGAVTPGATTVTATRLVIMPAETPHGKRGTNAGYHKNNVLGTVTNTSPLTMTTAGGVTVAVTTTADARVIKMVPGTISDLVVGANIQARTTGDAASPTTTEVRVMPARAARRGGKGKRRAAAAEAVTASTAATTPK